VKCRLISNILYCVVVSRRNFTNIVSSSSLVSDSDEVDSYKRLCDVQMTKLMEDTYYSLTFIVSCDK